jgi:hypothetical protein
VAIAGVAADAVVLALLAAAPVLRHHGAAQARRGAP